MSLSIFCVIFSLFNINNEKILKNLSINGIDISEMNIEEARKKINSEVNTKLNTNINLVHNEYETSIIPTQFEVQYNVDEAIREAYNIGRSGNIIQNNFEILGTLTSGKNIESKDRNSILIHSELAKKNHLKVGDTIRLNSHTYTIKGIFEGKKHETYTGLSSDFSENMVFVDYQSLDTNMVTKLTIDSNDLKQVQSIYPSIEYIVSKDTKAYQSALESAQSVKHMIQILCYFIIVCGLIVLSLVLTFWLRNRVHEIGILLAIGKSKMEIIFQFVLELIFISIPLGIVVCVISLVFNQVSSFLLSYGLLMSIIIVSVLIASFMIMIKKPREILTKLS